MVPGRGAAIPTVYLMGRLLAVCAHIQAGLSVYISCCFQGGGGGGEGHNIYILLG